MANRQRPGSRLRHCRRRFSRLRDGGTAIGRPINPRGAARSRRRGSQPLDPYSARLWQDLRRCLGELVLRGRARPRCERPPHLLATRQGAGRILLDQRHGLYPRPARGFRPLAPIRQYRLVLDRRAAVFQARPASDPRRRRIPQHRRPALRLRHHRAPSDLRSLHQGRDGTRLSAQRRLQWREAGRRRLSPDHHAQRQALFHRRRLPASGTHPSQPSRHHRRARREGAVRRQTRRRRCVPRIWPAAHGSCRARSDPVRRRGELAAASAAVRRWSAGSTGAVRHPGGAPSARRREEPAGPLLGADQAEMPPADHGERRDAEQPEEAEGRAAILPVPLWPAHPCGRTCGGVRAHTRSLPRRM